MDIISLSYIMTSRSRITLAEVLHFIQIDTYQ